MTNVPVQPHEIRRIHDALADEVSARERRLGEDLPLDATAGLGDLLHDVVDNWESGRKSLRTVPVCNVFARELDRPVSEETKRLATGLDAIINVYDDIIDTRELTTEAKIAYTVNAAFSGVAMVESCPPGAREAVNEVLLDYFTAVFQIPLVERTLFERMEAMTSRHLQLNAAATLYRYRARDIDAFAELPAAVMDVDADVADRLRADLRAYRARRLLFKDIGDVERDLDDGDTTPVVYFLQTCETTEAVVDAVEELYARFTYSDVGRDRYGDVLTELEDAPADLDALIRETRDAVAERAA
ncbi:hypothetical protein ACFO0N_14445 [Halobium salinum]|uniref:Uncharacterized protein n=1 Tax=Halobium salinum TaxID=1364940 RepID=A0ABD5PEG0_9EURY|nr:hypothetical protein [Halobium salinum]